MIKNGKNFNVLRRNLVINLNLKEIIMTIEKTTAELVAEYKAKGGKVTRIKSNMPKGNTRTKPAMNEYKSR